MSRASSSWQDAHASHVTQDGRNFSDGEVDRVDTSRPLRKTAFETATFTSFPLDAARERWS